MTLAEIRRHFPHTAHTRYLNHAATSPLSRPVRAAVEAFMDERHGATADAPINNYASFMEVIAETRAQLGQLVGATPARIAFVQNTSTALNVLARGIDWQPGDRVAVPGCEFPANVYPFMNLTEQGVAVDFIPHDEGTFTLAAIADTLRPETRLLTLSWVQFLSGFRADVAAIGALCKDRDVLFCVDAIQGLGALPLDAEAAGIDFLACGGHKWLMAMQGIGFLYCAERLQPHLKPGAGWLHGPVDWENFFDYELQFHPDARRFELGTVNAAGIAALHAALGVYFAAGPDWCAEQVLARSRQLAEALADLGYARYGTAAAEHASGIVTVHADAPKALFAHLQDRGMVAALRNRKLRFAPTYYNTPEEMDAVAEAVAAFDPAPAAN